MNSFYIFFIYSFSKKEYINCVFGEMQELALDLCILSIQVCSTLC